MKKSRKLEKVISVISLFLSLFMTYGIGRSLGRFDNFMIVAILFAIEAVISAGILE